MAQAALKQFPAPDVLVAEASAVAQRIRRVMAQHQVDGVEFANQVGVPYTTMRAYLSTTPRLPSAEFLVGVYKAFGVMPGWLLTGEGPSTRADLPAIAPTEQDHVLIPRYAVAAAAGSGAAPAPEPEGEYRVGTISMPQQWLRLRGLAVEKLRAISVYGTSMQPLLNDKDLVIMNTADTRLRSGFAYVLRHDDELLVKYCEMLPTGALRISSANTAFAPYEIDLSKVHDFAVLGRVVYSMRDW